MEPGDTHRTNKHFLSQGLRSSCWSHLQPFMKLLCRIIVLIDSRTQKQADKLLSVVCYLYGLIEMPFLVLCLFYGTILSIVTAIIALPIIVIQSAIVFRPVIINISLEVVTGLWRGFQQLCLDSGVDSDETSDESAWPILNVPEASLAFNADMDAPNGIRLPEMMAYEPKDVLEFGYQTLGSWKVSDTVEEPPRRPSLTSDLRISTSPFRRHRRTRTGSSSMSVSSSPGVVRTTAFANEEAGESIHRSHRSGSSSPEHLFRMTALSEARRAQSTSDLRRHNRSGSSSTTSLRSVGRIRGLDRF